MDIDKLCDPVRCCGTVVAALFFLWCWSVIMEHSQSPWLALQNGPLHIVPALIHFTVAGFHFPRDYRQQTGKAVCGWEMENTMEKSLRGEEATCVLVWVAVLFSCLFVLRLVKGSLAVYLVNDSWNPTQCSLLLLSPQWCALHAKDLCPWLHVSRCSAGSLFGTSSCICSMCLH